MFPRKLGQAAPHGGVPPSWTRILVAAATLFVAVLAVLYATIGAARLAGLGVLVVRGTADDSIASGSVVFGRWIAPRDVRPGQRIVFEARRGSLRSPPRFRTVTELSAREGRILASTHDSRGGGDESRYVLSTAVISPVFSFPYAGYLLALLLTPIGWLLAFALPITMLGAVSVRRIWAGDLEVPAVGLADG